MVDPCPIQKFHEHIPCFYDDVDRGDFHTEIGVWNTTRYARQRSAELLLCNVEAREPFPRALKLRPTRCDAGVCAWHIAATVAFVALSAPQLFEGAKPYSALKRKHFCANQLAHLSRPWCQNGPSEHCAFDRHFGAKRKPRFEDDCQS